MSAVNFFPPNCFTTIHIVIEVLNFAYNYLLPNSFFKIDQREPLKKFILSFFISGLLGTVDVSYFYFTWFDFFCFVFQISFEV